MITHQQLLETLDYNHETGVFTWKKSTGPVKKGSEAGYITSEGYIQLKINGKQYFAHRLAYFYVNKKFPDVATDHINGNRRDNRISNLRSCTFSENNQNQIKRLSRTTSEHIGVCFDKQRNGWVSQIQSGGKRVFKRFINESDAVCFYNEVKKQMHTFNHDAGQRL